MEALRPRAPRHPRGEPSTRRPGRLSAVPDVSGRPPLDPWAGILRTGKFDHTVYPTPSEARFAALCHLLRRGWTAADITAAAVDGRFPGLLTLFTKHRQRVAALIADLQRAVTKLTSCFDRPLLPNAPHKGPPTPPALPEPAPDWRDSTATPSCDRGGQQLDTKAVFEKALGWSTARCSRPSVP